MIIRTWRGWAALSNQGAYVEHFIRSVVPELRGVEGFAGATLLREVRADQVEFCVVTKWTSLDAIHGFAGDDITRAVVEPEAVAVLLDFDKAVRHYEVVEEIVT
jgi:heme-degrading monooxygenase HmoA